MDSFTGMPLTRAPKGFPKDHPAMDLLLCRQWGVEAKMPAKAALKKDFAKEVIRCFRLASPLVDALNTPSADLYSEKAAAACLASNRRKLGKILEKQAKNGTNLGFSIDKRF
jgi:hypothetical protein